MGDIFNGFVQLIGGIFGEQRLGKLFTVIVIIAALLGFFALWDGVTGDFTLRATEKKITLLSDLHRLEQEGIMNSSELYPLYQKMVQEVQEYKSPLSTLSMNETSPDLFQFLGGMLVWIAMALVIVSAASTTNKVATFVVAIGAGVSLGYVGTITPNSTDNGVNVLLGTMVQFGIIGLIILYGKITLWRSKRNKPIRQT